MEYNRRNAAVLLCVFQSIKKIGRTKLGRSLIGIFHISDERTSAKNVKKNYPEAVLVFIMPPSVQELERRLRGRNDTPEDQITIRMERAKWEMEQNVWYDHVVVNDDAGRCAGEILEIIDR